jgi:hypothetical protein
MKDLEKIYELELEVRHHLLEGIAVQKQMNLMTRDSFDNRLAPYYTELKDMLVFHRDMVKKLQATIAELSSDADSIQKWLCSTKEI